MRAIGGNLAVATELVSDGVEVGRTLIHRRLRRQLAGDRLVRVELQRVLIPRCAGQARIEHRVRVIRRRQDRGDVRLGLDLVPPGVQPGLEVRFMRFTPWLEA